MDDLIAETDADMMHFTILSIKQPTKYTESFRNQALRCHRIYDEYVLKGFLRIVIIGRPTWTFIFGALRPILQYMLWLYLPLRWQNYNMVCATPMHHDTMTRTIANVETMKAEPLTLTILLPTKLCQNRLAKMRRHLNLLSLRNKFGTSSSKSVPSDHIHPDCHQRLSTKCHSAVPVWQKAIQLQNAWQFHLNSAQRLSARAKPASLLPRDVRRCTHRICTAHAQRQNTVQHRRRNIKKPIKHEPQPIVEPTTQQICQ